MVWVRSPVYFYKRKDTYYFSRAVPADLQHRFNIVTEPNYNNNLAYQAIRSTIKTLPAALPEPRPQVPGPRAAVHKTGLLMACANQL